MKFRFVAISLGLFAALMMLNGTLSGAPAELKLGRYVGFIQPDNSKTVIAAVADVYLYQPADLKSFPRMQMTLRVGFGGLTSGEYVTETYTDIQYDFDNGHLTFDEPHKNFVIHALIENRGKPMIAGEVWIKSSAVSGKIELTLLSDEPDDEPGDKSATNSAVTYTPTISGAYVGQCESKKSILYLDASRIERSPHATADISTLTNYTVFGRLGHHDPMLCPTDRPSANVNNPSWCSIRQFTNVSFDAYSGKVLLEGSDGSAACRMKNETLSCTMSGNTSDESCVFIREPQPPLLPQKYFARKYYVSATLAEKAPLPEPSPPENTALIGALRGDFYGYLHHELTDRYQAVRLKVLSSTSTDNPHNPNMAFISPHLSLYFGRTTEGTAVLQDFARRTFYIRPGFTLDAEDNDLFFQIEEWKQGYIRGVLMSRAFGRVGTIQLVKRPLPVLPNEAIMIPDILGSFVGPKKSANDAPFWQVQLNGMNQNSDADDPLGTYSFGGEYRAANGATARRPIVNGSYDFFSMHVGLMAESVDNLPMLISGKIQDHELQLFWPGAPVFGIRLPDSHEAEIFTRTSSMNINTDGVK